MPLFMTIVVMTSWVYSSEAFTHGRSMNNMKRFSNSLEASKSNEKVESLTPVLPIISPEILKQFSVTLESMVTSYALNTNAYYMAEFRDDITKQWMLEFNDYKTTGFPDDNWKIYLESMIMANRQNVSVYMTPPEAFFGTRQRPTPVDVNMKLQYTHHVEPRKIAHSLLTIREDVSGELMADLTCIPRENAEIERYASEWMLHGKERAEQNRHITRNTDNEDSTPLRNKNYCEVAIYITNVALDLVKFQLSKKSSLGSVFLTSVVDTLDKKVEEMDPIDRFLHMPKGPCALIEEIYYKGITDGVVLNDDGESLNVLKIAQDLMLMRAALAVEASKILADLATNSRQYYKMIKDYGGFNKLESPQRPKFVLVDIRKVQEVMNSAPTPTKVADIPVKEVKQPVDSLSSNTTPIEVYAGSVSSYPDHPDINILEANPDDFGGGPMMM